MKLSCRNSRNNIKKILMLLKKGKINLMLISSYHVSIFRRNRKSLLMVSCFKNLIEKEWPCSKPPSAIGLHFLNWIGFSFWWRPLLFNTLKKEIITNLVLTGWIPLHILEDQLFLQVARWLVVLFLEELMRKSSRLILGFKKIISGLRWKQQKDIHVCMRK